MLQGDKNAIRKVATDIGVMSEVGRKANFQHKLFQQTYDQKRQRILQKRKESQLQQYVKQYETYENKFDNKEAVSITKSDYIRLG